MVIENNMSTNFVLNDENGTPPKFERKGVDFQDIERRFTNTTTDYAKQFFHMYSCRLEELRPYLSERAQKKWGDVKQLKLPEVENFENERCIIIGTLFKHQLWKPSILRELGEDTDEPNITPEKHDNYCSEKDQPFLEDGTSRIKLVGSKVVIAEIITGVVCGILGKKLEDGSFDVEDWCFAGCPPHSSMQSPPASGKLLLISGLNLVNNYNTLPLNLFVEWINGMAGTVESQRDVASVVNVLIAGNSIKSSGSEVQLSKGLTEAKAQEIATANEISSATAKLDELMSEIVTNCCVTLMPGQYDPTNVMLPQRPIQRFMLRESSKYKSFKGVSNPWVGSIGNRLIGGSSGQPIEDILRVSGATDITPIQWLERTLDWRHYSPTAPDTLPAYPFHVRDLFIMQECPDIYFVGNTEKFETKLWKGEEGQTVRLVCIPKFSTTSTAVIVDLETLETTTISFGVN
ncbi:hypothetical protein PV326_013375 [Microctonus aethiopoides]|nr:hypothetical protein PV326_013375 [Microctonus aethiopoides]